MTVSIPLPPLLHPGQVKKRRRKQNTSKVSVFESVGSERTKSSNPLKADFFDEVKFFFVPLEEFFTWSEKKLDGKKIKKEASTCESVILFGVRF